MIDLHCPMVDGGRNTCAFLCFQWLTILLLFVNEASVKGRERVACDYTVDACFCCECVHVHLFQLTSNYFLRYLVLYSVLALSLYRVNPSPLPSVEHV